MAILEMSRDRHDHGLAGGPQRSPMPPKTTYSVREEPLGTAQHVRIVGIGAGASGLNMIRTLRKNLTNYEVVVYEKNAEVGGTWVENRYPGCRCDVPSHSYQFSWKPKHDWSNFFSPAEEIGEYLRQVCDEEGMREVIKTEHQIVSARWNERDGLWSLRVLDLQTGEEFEDYANFLIDGSGILNNWKWPSVPGRETFQGTLIHTARWPKDFDATNKTIAVIGNGSTGLQVLPELQKDAKKLYHIVRTPTWVLPPRIQSWKIMGQAKELLNEIDIDDDEDFSQETMDKFKSDPAFYRKFVKGVEKEVNSTFPIALAQGPIQAFARAKVAEYMTAMLGGNEDLCKKLIPTHPLGFRRMTPGAAYLQALTKPNVTVTTSNIKRFVPEGIQLDTGEILLVDTIVCATGFESSFLPRFPLVGRNGVDLQDRWRKEVPKAYMSCAVPDLPNYFMFLGPNGPIGHGSVFTASEQIAKYIVRVIKKCQTEGIKAVAPSQRAVDDYFEHVSMFMPRTVWATQSRSWFTNGQPGGPVTALHPGSRIHFFHMLQEFRGEDFEYTYDNSRGNRFGYLGNGFSTKELDPSGDATWYLHDEGVL